MSAGPANGVGVGLTAGVRRSWTASRCPADVTAAGLTRKADNPVQGGGWRPAVGAMRPVLLLCVSGKGRHELTLAVRMRLERRGGWRVAEGMLPWAPASAVTLTVPEKGTEIRLAHVHDRHSYETAQPDQKLETALGPAGAISIQWRPKVAEGQVDRSLTVRSSALLDVQEEGLRVAWQLALDFPRSQREFIDIVVPKDYIVEKIEGANVRGWVSAGRCRPERAGLALEGCQGQRAAHRAVAPPVRRSDRASWPSSTRRWWRCPTPRCKAASWRSAAARGWSCAR